MRITLALIASSALFLLGCHPEKDKPIDLTDISTKMTDASELFFKNIRQSDYTLTENEAAKMKIFRLKKYPENAVIKLDLMQNWYTDDVYLMVDWKPPFNKLDGFVITSKDSSNNQTKEILFENGPIKKQVEFSVKLYNELLAKNTLYIASDSGQVYLFNASNDLESFRKTVFDFLRLTELR